jgi:hypothetical protein
MYIGKVTLRSLATNCGHNVQKLSFNVTFVLISLTEEEMRIAVKIKRQFRCIKLAPKIECLLHTDVFVIRR